jgi:hypothetical protein
MASTGHRKEEVVTFKVDEELARALGNMPNKSDFIRRAILTALGNACPVCSGTGSLTVSQMQHWEEFAAHHHVETCTDCDETRLVCDHELVAQ